jgi:hypothetical protein
VPAHDESMLPRGAHQVSPSFFVPDYFPKVNLRRILCREENVMRETYGRVEKLAENHEVCSVCHIQDIQSTNYFMEQYQLLCLLSLNNAKNYGCENK